MKKIISIISLVITTGVLLLSLFMLTQFNLRGYTSLLDSEVTQIQKLINNNPQYFSEDSQRFFELHTDMKEVNEELEKRGDIISKTKEFNGLILFCVSILFIISLYNLVIAFRNKENSFT